MSNVRPWLFCQTRSFLKSCMAWASSLRCAGGMPRAAKIRPKNSKPEAESRKPVAGSWKHLPRHVQSRSMSSLAADYEIARSAKMLPIADIARNLGIPDEFVEPFGRYQAKI